MKFSRRHLQIAAAAAVALAAAAWLWPHRTQPSQKEIQIMQKFTQNMQTHCVGRFLIDAPDGTDTGENSYGFQIANVHQIQKATRPAADTLRHLDQELAARAARQVGRKDGYGDPMPDAKTYQAGANVRSIWYIEDGKGKRIDGYVVRPGGTFFFETSAYDNNDIKEFNDFLIEIEPTLSVRENSVIPTTPGFCIDDGLIAMNPKGGESLSWGWKLPGHPEVTFGLTTRANDDKVDEGILDREADILKELKAAMGAKGIGDLKTLRKRRFDLNGRAAQEWLREITDEAPEYQFDIEIPGKPNDLRNPSINLSLRVGGSSSKGHVKPSLTPGEAMALWDAVIQSLRLRPGAV